MDDCSFLSVDHRSTLFVRQFVVSLCFLWYYINKPKFDLEEHSPHQIKEDLMKRFFTLTVLFLVIFLAAPVLAGDIPDLTGDWHATASMFVVKDGDLHVNKDIDIPGAAYTISRQEGRLIFGVKKFTRKVDGVEHEENFVGVISEDGDDLYMADHEAGYAVGKIYDGGAVIELTYLMDGSSNRSIEMAAGIHQLTRK